ncbi:hypothetical protein Hdeb2414_s0017g00507131 [Helianthus debilis subsp. tardiflorus]
MMLHSVLKYFTPHSFPLPSQQASTLHRPEKSRAPVLNTFSTIDLMYLLPPSRRN